MNICLRIWKPFFDLKNNTKKKVRIVIQVWQVENIVHYRPTLLKLQDIKKDFELSYNISPLPNFFIRIWTTIEKVGEITPSHDTNFKLVSPKKWVVFKKNQKLGTMNDKKKNGTLLAIHVNENVEIEKVFKILSNLYINQYWQKYKKNTYDGHNNPQISKREIYFRIS